MKRLLFLFVLIPVCSIVNAQVRQNVSAPQPRYRIICDNDFAGDPDGLLQLAHLVMCPSLEIRALTGSGFTGFNAGNNGGEKSAKAAEELLMAMNEKHSYPILYGDEASKFIVDEAMRTDTKTPLLVLCGAGLETIARALEINPDIESKFTLLWIGGQEYPELTHPLENASAVEYNLNISIPSVAKIFNSSNLAIWQIPRNVYRQALISMAELKLKLDKCGSFGKYLYDKFASMTRMLSATGTMNSETYVMGDSPLVLLSALQTTFEAGPASSSFKYTKAPKISDKGLYIENSQGRLIRVFTSIDTGLMFGDFYAKLEQCFGAESK